MFPQVFFKYYVFQVLAYSVLRRRSQLLRRSFRFFRFALFLLLRDIFYIFSLTDLRDWCFSVNICISDMYLFDVFFPRIFRVTRYLIILLPRSSIFIQTHPGSEFWKAPHLFLLDSLFPRTSHSKRIIPPITLYFPVCVILLRKYVFSYMCLLNFMFYKFW